MTVCLKLLGWFARERPGKGRTVLVDSEGSFSVIGGFFRRCVLVAAAAVLLLAGCGGGDGATDEAADTGPAADTAAAPTTEEPQNIELTFGSSVPAAANPAMVLLDEKFFPELEQRVAEETPHTLSVTRHWGGTVIGVGEELDGISSGLVDMGTVIHTFEAEKMPLHVFSLEVPFQSPDFGVIYSATKKTLESIPALRDAYGEFNQTYLMWIGGTSGYDLAGNFPVTSVEDVKGKRIGAAGANLAWVEPVGAVPVQASITEWYTNLQTGVVDSTIMYPEGAVNFRLYEVFDHYTRVGFGGTNQVVFTINNDALDKLPESVRTILTEMIPGWEEEIIEKVTSVQDDAYALFEREGVEMSTLPDEERQRWAEALPNLPKQFAEEMEADGLPGYEVMEMYLQAQIDEGHEFIRPWLEELRS